MVTLRWNHYAIICFILVILSLLWITFVGFPKQNSEYTKYDGVNVYFSTIVKHIQLPVKGIPSVTAKHVVPAMLAVQRIESGWAAEPTVCSAKADDFIHTTLHTPYGDTRIYVHDPKEDVDLSGSLVRTGSWQGNLLPALSRCLEENPDAVFLDLGANIGVFSLSMAKSGRFVIAVEPLPANAMRLCRSIQDGNMSGNFRLVHSALSDRRVWVEIISQRWRRSYGRTYIREMGGPKRPGEVPEDIQGKVYTAYLDDLLDVFNFTKAVVKLDVERHEARVISRGQEFFRRVDVPCLLMEWQHQPKAPDSFRLMVQMAELGMLAYPVEGGNKSLHASDFAKWPDDVLWKKVRDYGPETQ